MTSTDPVMDDRDFELATSLLLSKWRARTGESREFVGNEKHITEVLRILSLGQDQLADGLMLERAYAQIANDRAQMANDGAHPDTCDGRYAPLPFTLATYMLREVVRSKEVQTRINEQLQNRRGDGLVRYKMQVLRNAFLWLGDLTQKSDWYEPLFAEYNAATGGDGRRVRNRLHWLTSTRTREFCEGPIKADPKWEDRRSAIEELWGLFAGNHSLPIEFAFCAARLEPERWSDRWSQLRGIVRSLLEAR